MGQLASAGVPKYCSAQLYDSLLGHLSQVQQSPLFGSQHSPFTISSCSPALTPLGSAASGKTELEREPS